MARDIMIDEAVFTAAEIEDALKDWYRNNYLPAGQEAEIGIFGIMNKVYFTVETQEDSNISERNKGGGAQTP